MCRFGKAGKANVGRRMGPPHRQSVAQIPPALGIHMVTLYNWRKTWQLQGKVVPAIGKKPEGWNATDKFPVVLETAELNTTELSDEERERILLTCNEPEFAALPSRQIVPVLADPGLYNSSGEDFV